MISFYGFLNKDALGPLLRILYRMGLYRKAKIEGGDIFVNLFDPRGLSIYKAKAYSSGSGEQLPKLWRASLTLNPSYFLDIGANYGEISLTTRYPKSVKKIYLIEPNPNLVKALEKSVAIHPASKKIKIIKKAMSDRDNQRVEFTVPFTSSGLGSIKVTRLYNDLGKQHFEVLTSNLDSLLKNIASKVIVVKIDVEGAELDVLKGARKTMSNNKCLIFLEISSIYLEQLKLSLPKVFEYLNSIGYLYYPDGKRNDFILLKNKTYEQIWSIFSERGLLSSYYKRNDSIIGDFILFSNKFKKTEINKFLLSAG